MKAKTLAAVVLAAICCLTLVSAGMDAQSAAQSSPTPPGQTPTKQPDLKMVEPKRPNFLGTWQLSKEKSDFGGMPAPEKMERVVAGPDPVLLVTTKKFEGEKKTEAVMKYFTNSFETKNFINGQNAYSSTRWEASVFAIKTNMQDRQGGYVVIVDRWQLSEDRKTLTTTTKISTTQGEINEKLVWERAEVPDE